MKFGRMMHLTVLTLPIIKHWNFKNSSGQTTAMSTSSSGVADKPARRAASRQTANFQTVT